MRIFYWVRMANKRQCVPVYSLNAESKSEQPLRRVTVDEALVMIAPPVDDRGRRLRDSKGNPIPAKAIIVSEKNAPLKIQLTQLERVDGSSPCSISYQEVLANVGISDKRGEHNFVSRSRMQQVQQKVAAFAIPSWQDRVVTA